MRRIRLFVVIVFVLLVSSGVSLYLDHRPTRASDAQVVSIYERLSHNSGQDVPPLIILQSPIVNAWTDGSSVVITTSMLEVMQNEDQIAMVLGHEIAHAINNDVLHDDQEQSIVEAHADKLGAFIMMRAGFDICKGKDFFTRMKDLYGDTAASQDHPSFAFRHDQLNLPQCNKSVLGEWL